MIEAVVCAALVAAALVTAAPAQAAPTSNGGGRIVGVPSGKCLDVTGASTSPGTRVQLWSCLGDPQQAWAYSGGQLKVYGSDTLCLDANDNYHGANGTPVQVWTCNGGRNQQWSAEANGTLVSEAYGLCLDAVNGGETNGTLLQLWKCIGDAQQDWTGAPAPNGGGPVKGLGSGRCLDVPGAAISPGMRVQLWNCLGDAQQQWQLNRRQLQVYGDDCLDARNDGTTPGTPVQLWYCLGDPQQQWSWGADGTIRSLPSGLCLDAVNRGTTNGTLLQLWTCNGGSGQSWSRGVVATPPPAPLPPVSTAPVTTPIPQPTARHGLKVRMVLSWTWRGRTTWLHGVRIGTFPGRTRLSLRCTGRGCPRRSALTARGRRAIHRLVRLLSGRRYRSGDVLSISLTADGYLPERAQVIMRDDREPRVRAARR